MNSMISPSNTIALLAIICAVIYSSLWLEKTYTWAHKISAAILGLFGIMILSNVGIIPNNAPIYDTLMEYTIPMGLTLLLLRANVFTILNESGRLISIFLLSSIGSLLATFVAYFFFKDVIPNVAELSAMSVASYTGGSVNFFAMTELYNAPKELTSIALVADNFLSAIFFFVIMSSFTIEFLERFLSSREEKAESITLQSEKTIEAFTLEDLAKSLGIAFCIIAVTYAFIAGVRLVFPATSFSSNFAQFLYSLITNKYLLLTTFTVIVASLLPKQVGAIAGSDTLGIYFMYVFLACIGAYASFMEVFKNGFYVFLFCFIIITGNLVFTIAMAKLFKFNAREALLASNANIGGATTGAVMAIAKNWKELLVPVVLVGTLGNIIGNYMGILVGYLLLGK